MKDNLLQHQKSAGFTLVEVLIALAVSGILLASVLIAFKSQQDHYLAQDQVVEMQENIRAGVGNMIQELRMAGYDPYCSGKTGIVTADSTSVSFTLVSENDNQDNDNDGATDETGEISTITFNLYDAYSDGDTDIGRQEGVNAIGAIAENIDALEFYYLDADGDVTADTDEIKSIRISVLARSDQPGDLKNTQTYTSASGATWTCNDFFRRRFQIITVHLRNLDT